MSAVTFSFFLVLQWSLSAVSSFTYDSVAVEMMQDVILTKRLSQGIAFICWQRGDFKFLKKLWSAGVQLAVWKPSERNTAELSKLKRSWFQMFIIIDLRCEGSGNLVELLHVDCGSANYHWLILESGVQRTHWRRDGEVLLAERTNHSTFNLSDMYTDVDSTNVTVFRGTWVSGEDNASNILHNVYKFSRQRRGNLARQPLRIAAAPMSTVYSFTNLDHKTGYIPHDLNMAFFAIIRQMFNFSVNLQIIPNTTIGNTAIEEKLMDGTADIVPIIQAFVAGRTNYVNYVHACGKLVPIIVFRQPSTSSLRNVFLLPFSTTTWLALFFTSLISILMLRITVALSETKVSQYEEPWDTSELVLYVLGFVCQQGSARTPYAWSARIITLALLIPLLLLYSNYSGQVISLLSTKDNPISSMQDLVQFKYQLYIDDYPYLDFYFMNPSNPAIKQVGRSRKRLALTQSMNYVLKGFTCYSTADFLIRLMTAPLSTEQRCKLGSFDLPHATVPLSMTVPKNSEYQEMFNWGTIKLTETGIVSKLNSIVKAPLNLNCPQATFESVPLEGLSFAFVILAFGNVAAIIVLLVECLVITRDVEYGSSVWDPHQGYLIQELEKIQRKAARFVLGDFRQKSSITNMLQSLGWEDLGERRRAARLSGNQGNTTGRLCMELENWSQCGQYNNHANSMNFNL